ncbi:MAG: hypothetical protein QJR01_05020 [Kyrpidia sp.]|nr:hypothetical protein [Kyrpidia sp.]
MIRKAAWDVFRDFWDAVNAVYASYNRASWVRAGLRETDDRVPAPGRRTGPDALWRRPDLTRRVLDGLDKPDRAAPAVIVAGSKGKGSTARMIAGILRAHGLRAGLFTGPHLLHPMERITVDGQSLAERDFVRWMNEVYPVVQRVTGGLRPEEYMAPVGVYLAVALCAFREAGMDVHVLECGRGARYDDVAQVQARWAAVTPVMGEHLKELGPTLSDVAWHKAGAIRPGMAAAFAGRQGPEATAALRGEAKAAGVPLAILGRDFFVAEAREVPAGLSTVFVTPGGRRVEATLPAAGRFQADNAALAAAAAEAILGEILPGSCGIREWTDSLAARGLAGVAHPGRCDILSRDPLVLVDGAVTAGSAAEIRRLVELWGGRVAVIAAVPSDKDYPGVYRELAPVGDTLILTRAGNGYFAYPEDGPALARRWYRRVETAADLKEAWQRASSWLAETECGGHSPRGRSGIVLAGAQPFVAEALLFLTDRGQHGCMINDSCANDSARRGGPGYARRSNH